MCSFSLAANMEIQLYYLTELLCRICRCIHSAFRIGNVEKRQNRRHSHIEVSQMWLRTTLNEKRRRQWRWRQWDPEKATQDGFIKNFDHRQMGSLGMEALIQQQHTTRGKRDRDEGREKILSRGTAMQRPLKLLAIYLSNSPLHESSVLRVSAGRMKK